MLARCAAQGSGHPFSRILALMRQLAGFAARHGRRERKAALAAACCALAGCVFFFGWGAAPRGAPGVLAESDARPAAEAVLRIYDWKTGALYAQAPVREGSRLFFGWMHSQEKIAWNEYFHVDASLSLVLDAISFPAFGAGIPENKGRVCFVKDGLIHMQEIDQKFTELVWLNSHTATRDIVLDGVLIARGCELPHHARLCLFIEKR
jgi:hypothetical protein